MIMSGRKEMLRALCLVLGLSLLVGGVGLGAPDREKLKQDLERLSVECRPFTDLFSKTIQLVMPSVASISTHRKVKIRVPEFGPEDFFDLPDPFWFWERRPRERQWPRPREREFETTGLGSGFVIDAQRGYVVTNAHVVSEVKAEDIQLTFPDGTQLTAQKVLRDPKTDVAVIKVEPKNLVAVEWGNSEDLQIGEWVIAIGSPMGFGNTVTAGIISATSTKNRVIVGGKRLPLRAIRNPYAYEDYIQTDAAINPGNSGGPLVTLGGKVIGLNTLIISSTRAFAGLGFAVPERIARPVVETLIEKGRVVRGHLGVSIINPEQVDDDAAWELFQMRTAEEVFDRFRIKKDDKGALVAGVVPGGPAEKAGIEQGDLILAVDHTPTPDVDTLRDLIAATPPGTKVTITLLRRGRKRKVSVELGEQPEGEVAVATLPGRAFTSEELGLTVQTLTSDLADALGYPSDLEGVVITNVASGSPADKAGLQRNDVILQVGRKQVTSVDDFQEAVKDVGPEGVALLIRRGEETRFISVRP